MGTAFDSITPTMRAFIERQHLFFVATAPRSGGNVNMSPKGHDSFRVLGPHRVAYLDLTGSGAETIAHVRENGRITFMFCAFEGKPNIVRLYGTGTVVRPGDAAWAELRASFTGRAAESDAAIRAIITADIHRTSNSCGYAVPLMEFAGERTRLLDWAATADDAELDRYRAKNNATSIDGLPALG
jgi:hypothetical protein